MQSREKKAKALMVFDADVVLRTNAMKLRLLKLIPEFQKDVKKIRAEFNIYPQTAGESDHDYFKEFEEWQQKSGIENFDEGSQIEFRRNQAPNIFKNRVFAIGEKFRLPYNLYCSSLWGLPFYVVTNRMSVPTRNWAIEYDIPEAGKKKRWVAIKAYGLLNADETKEAMRELREAQLSLMDNALTKSPRARIEFETNLPIVEMMLQRCENPKRIRIYKDGSYLARITKQHPISASQRKKLEKIHTTSVRMGLSERPADEIAKKFNRKGNTAQKAYERMNKTALNLFGYGLPRLDTSPHT